VGQSKTCACITPAETVEQTMAFVDVNEIQLHDKNA